MSQGSSIKTRSQTRKMAEKVTDTTITDSGLQSERMPGSPSVVPTISSTPAPVIPLAGGRLIDHTRRSTLAETRTAPEAASRQLITASSRASTRRSRRSAEYLRKKVEYEAELEIVRMKENLVKKRLEADLAQIDIDDDNDDSCSENDGTATARRVEDWVAEVTPMNKGDRAGEQKNGISEKLIENSEMSAQPISGNNVPDTYMDAPHASTSRVSVKQKDFRPPDGYARKAPSVAEWRHGNEGADQPMCREPPGEQGDGVLGKLADALRGMTRPRPIPRQAYELPQFNGDPAEWISYRNMYWDTAHLYEFRPHENIARLKTSLQGEAKIAVEDLLRTSRDPAEIIAALEEEYGHPTLILRCALKKIRDLPKVSESGQEFRKFATTVRNCVSLLKNVRAEGYVNNPQLVNELLQKLTPVQRSQYGEYAMRLDRTRGVDLRICPNLEMLSEYLAHQARVSSYHVGFDTTTTVPVSTNKSNKNAPQQIQNKFKPTTRTITTQRVHVHQDNTANDKNETEQKCAMCQAKHTLVKCEKFLGEQVDKRWELVKENRLCFKCLECKHAKKFCKAPRCEKCDYAHHVLLHADKKRGNPERVTNVGAGHTSALLKVLPVTIETKDKSVKCYALLDDGATVSLIDNQVSTGMDGPNKPLVLRTARGHDVSDLQSRVVSVNVTGPSGVGHSIKCHTIKDLNLPPQTIDAAVIRDNAHLRDLGCEEMRGARPLLLIGQDNWELLVSREIRRGRSGKPVASNTTLGWVIHGPHSKFVHSEDSINSVAISLPDLHGLVKSQFELEAIGITHQPRQHHEVDRAVKILDDTSQRIEDGKRWEVGLLWKRDDTELPDNYGQALQRLAGIERRMKREPAFAEAYKAQIDRLIKEGYARKVCNSDRAMGTLWYLPHFGVINPNKPGKLRLVFDAAASYQGKCLNDNLLTGPDLLNPLLGVLLKFRIGKVGFSGDIADMFLRIKVRPEDQGVQRFLWRDTEGSERPSMYVMTSMIFGAASSPTTAIYILNKNAGEYEDSSPRAVKAIKSKHYMDDYLDSADTEGEAASLIEEVTRIHASGGFNIRGWVTNSNTLREQLQLTMPERVALEKGEGATERTLGLIWAPGTDTLAFDLSFKRLPTEISSGESVPTKRQFLSFIMSIFDPLGFLYPCIIQSRMLMQRIWKTGTQWDEPLKEKDAKLWFEWLNNLHKLNDIKVPRWYGVVDEEVELHVFGDASELAYAAVAYIVGKNAVGGREVAILMGKARVAPQKVISIPRLELQAAVLASRLGETVTKELGLRISKKHFWTDSKTVLMWINSEAYEFQKFVSHRLSEIDRLTDRGDWRWVPSGENPADKATRLEWPNNCSEWISGPLFLRFPENQWPTCRRAEASGYTESPEAASERVQRVHTTASTGITTSSPLLQHERQSTWTLTLRTMARVLAFTERCRRRRTTAQLRAQDLRDAELRLLRIMQADSFAEELRTIGAGLALPKGSRLRSVDPMVTSDGLLRVRGRLAACEEISFDARHPVILDGRHPLTVKMIKKYHAAALHANHETVVNNVRERFWVLHLRPTVIKVAASCQTCRIRRAKPIYPKMGDLPAARLTSSRRAFVHVGVDYFGPMEVAIGRRREKRWGALFTCLTTRAVHLELASSLSSDSAILALRRLIARRGQPAHIYSDRGTNFVGANNELRAALRTMNKETLKEEATAKGIEWHFNPPAAPHMGGCWERLVRSVKVALQATLRERAPREEVLYTLLTEAELVINSRPLYYVASNAEQTVITPNHLLLGTASGDTPYVEPRECDADGRSQWRKVNALADVFWRRWQREYLPTLQQRQKWTSGESNLREGDVVVVIDELRPRNKWAKGIIQKVHYGADNIVRVIDVRTATGVLRRPVVKVVVLPTDPVV